MVKGKTWESEQRAKDRDVREKPLQTLEMSGSARSVDDQEDLSLEASLRSHRRPDPGESIRIQQLQVGLKPLLEAGVVSGWWFQVC